MKRYALAFALGLLPTLASAVDVQCGSPFTECRPLEFKTTVTEVRRRIVDGKGEWSSITKTVSANLRSGYIAEASNVPFKGNLLYFEGLADSIRNHAPFFLRLSAEGYRVIAFDYLGQGGSEGLMDDTRIADIPKIGDLAWKRYARDLAHFPTRTVIGWSTGALAAYRAAAQNQVDRVVLIAPGIGLKSVYLITQNTLTSARYSTKASNPHLEKISPRSPLLVIDFACDLRNVAASARGEFLDDPSCLNPFAKTPKSPSPAWEIPGSIPGLVLLSDPKDKYVNSETTRGIIASHSVFEIEQYAGALHEIDNEKDSIREKAYSDIVSFLNRTNRK